MARPQTELAITLSVLDRLIDNEPKVSTEAPLHRAESVRQLKSAVRRDLEWLLNSRRIAVEPPESLRDLGRSVYTYGMPDFSFYNIGTAKDQGRLMRVLQNAVKLFEPRLANVRIVPIKLCPVVRNNIPLGALQLEGIPRRDQCWNRMFGFGARI